MYLIIKSWRFILLNAKLKALKNIHDRAGAHAWCRCVKGKETGGGLAEEKGARREKGGVEVEVARNYRFKPALVEAQSKRVCKGLLYQPNINNIHILFKSMLCLFR